MGVMYVDIPKPRSHNTREARGSSSYLAVPFRTGIHTLGLFDRPYNCSCVWVPARNPVYGMFELKYPDRLCVHHGDLA